MKNAELEQWLNEHHPGLVVTNDEGATGKVAIAVKGCDDELGSIKDKYADYRDDLRIDKTNTDVLGAYDRLTKKLEEITVEPLAKISIEENELTRKVSNSLSLHDDDPIRELINTLQATSDRAELAAMEPDIRRAAFHERATAGDPRLLKAVNGMLKPGALIPIPFLQDAKEKYVNTKFAEDVKTIETEKAKLPQMEMVKRAIPHVVNKLAKKHGLDIESAVQARKDSHNKALRSRSLSEKLKDVKDNGFQGFVQNYE